MIRLISSLVGDCCRLRTDVPRRKRIATSLTISSPRIRRPSAGAAGQARRPRRDQNDRRGWRRLGRQGTGPAAIRRPVPSTSKARSRATCSSSGSRRSRRTARRRISGSLLAPYAADPVRFRPAWTATPKRLTWTIDKAKGIARLDQRRCAARRHRAAAQADARLRGGCAVEKGGDRRGHPWRLRRQHGLRRHECGRHA